MSDNKVLTVEQVSEELQLGVATIRDMIRRGILPAARIGKQYRIKRVDVDRLLETGEPQQIK
jgi:excisionase family DNA binding protein